MKQDIDAVTSFGNDEKPNGGSMLEASRTDFDQINKVLMSKSREFL